ncbi:CPBP family intramembrane metalloprotease, partial [Klebsiella pneumoniae]
MSGLSSKSNATAAVRWEIVIVLAVTFGMSGLRATLRLVEALVSPTPLKGQTAQLNPSQASAAWLDVSLQVLSAGTLVGWGALAVYMLWVHPVTTNPLRFLRWSGMSDVWHGLAAAAAIGLPGLCFYGVARAWGMSATVDPAAGVRAWWSYVVLVISACATAWAEEVAVVGWLQTRLAQCGVSGAPRVVTSALLRG